MSNETEPEYIAGESWLDFLARRGIPRDKAESIHEIQWLRGERIRWMAEAERLRAELAARPAAAGWLTEVERQTLLYLRSILSSWGIAPNYPEVKEFYGNHLECLDAILDRAGSPPVVEVPAMTREVGDANTHMGQYMRGRQDAAVSYRAALDRAGIPWREVPRE